MNHSSADERDYIYSLSCMSIAITKKKCSAKNSAIALVLSKAALAAAAIADAMRKRASFPHPGPMDHLFCAVTLCHLTPARFSAMIWHRQIAALNGPGGAVLYRTTSEPRENHQHIEIAGFFAAVLRFCRMPSRDVRTGRRARAHIWGWCQKQRTPEPRYIYKQYQCVSGSSAVLVRFSIEPVGSGRIENGGFLRFFNKIEAGYSHRGILIGSKGLKGGRGGKKFRDWCRLVVAAGLAVEIEGPRAVQIGAAGRRGRNGGNRPFLDDGAHRVGMMMLEGCAERHGFLPFFAPRRKPLRLGLVAGSKGGGIGSTGTPPLPPSRTRALPSSMAREAGQNLDRRFALINHGARLGWKRPQRSSRGMGSGVESLSLWPADQAAAGWGDAAEKLRRSAKGNSGVRYVN